jgi:GTP cyclohydrolase II
MNKIGAYELQDKGFDTMDANIMLGHPGDARSYDRGVEILKSLGIARCRLLTNNPDKLLALSEAGIEVSERVAIEMQPDKYSRKYMQTKMQRFGHLYCFAQEKERKK